jgi:hypothetical protein
MRSKTSSSRLLLYLILMVIIIFLSAGELYAQSQGRIVAGREYAQYNGQWHAVANGQQGNVVDVQRIVVRLRDQGDIEQYNFSRAGLPDLLCEVV